MNRYERTHRELKKQLEQLIASDNDHLTEACLREDEIKEQIALLEAIMDQESIVENKVE